MGKINVDLAFTANTSAAKAQLDQLKNSLSQLGNMTNLNLGTKKVTDELVEASNAAIQLKTQLDAATNVNTGKLSLTKFNQELKTSGMSLSEYRQKLSALGPEGQKTFLQLTDSIMQADKALTTGSKLLANFAQTLANVAKYQFSTAVYRGITQSISTAYQYAQDLNASLNKIRIVTGQSVEQMDKFAEKANKAAKALSTTTTKYTDAALIFYQQGLNDKEVEKRTNVTIKMMNVTGQAAEEASSQMTAIWNNFAKGSENLEHYADVITALGAATASSSQEISEGLQKFAAIADTVGLSYEYATTGLATVVAQTRQSADVVGTAFKTLFARIQDLDLGKTLEDGTTLGKYAQALEVIGVNIKTASGDVKDMNTILDEMGAKWSTLSDATKIATAQTVAGQRQYAQLMALMDNWDKFQENLAIANASDGELQRQADIYADSWDAAKKRVQAAAEDIYKNLLDDKFFISLNNGFAKFLSAINSVIEGMGGLKGIIPLVTGLLLQFAGPQIYNGLRNIGLELTNMLPKFSSLGKNMRASVAEFSAAQGFKGKLKAVGTGFNRVTSTETYGDARQDALKAQAAAEAKQLYAEDTTDAGAIRQDNVEQRLTLQKQFATISSKLTADQKAYYQTLLDVQKTLSDEVDSKLEEVQATEKELDVLREKAQLIKQMEIDSNKDEQSSFDADVEKYKKEELALKKIREENLTGKELKEYLTSADAGLGYKAEDLKGKKTSSIINGLENRHTARGVDLADQVSEDTGAEDLGQEFVKKLQQEALDPTKRFSRRNFGAHARGTFGEDQIPQEVKDQTDYLEAASMRMVTQNVSSNSSMEDLTANLTKLQSVEITNPENTALVNEYAQAIQELQAAKNKTVEADNVVNEKEQEVQRLTNENKQGTAEYTQAIQELEAAKKAATEAQGAEEIATRKVGKSLQAFNVQQKKTQAAYKQSSKNSQEYRNTVGQVDQAQAKNKKSTEDLNQSIDKRNKKFKAAEKEMKKSINQNKSVGQSLMSVTQGLTQVASGINMLKSLGNIWNNEDLSTGEKLLTTITTMGMAIPMLTNGLKSLWDGFAGLTIKILGTNAAMLTNEAITAMDEKEQIKLALAAGLAANAEEAEKLVKQGLNQEQIKSIIISKSVLLSKMMETGGHWANVASLIAEKIAAGELYIIVLVLMAAIVVLVAAMAGLVAIVKAVNAAYNSDKTAMEAANALLDEQKKRLEDAKKAWEELKAAIADYHDQQDALDKLVKGTTEYNEALQAANDNVLNLIDKYPDLAKEVKNLNGRLVISDQGLKDLEQKGLDDVSAANAAFMNAKVGANNATAKFAQTSFLRNELDLDKSFWEQALNVLPIANGIGELVNSITEFTNGHTWEGLRDLGDSLVKTVLGVIAPEAGFGIGIAENIAEKELTDNTTDAIQALQEMYKTQGNSMFLNFSDAINEVAQGDLLVVQKLQEHQEALKELIKSNGQLNETNELLAQQQIMAANASNSQFANSKYQDFISAAGISSSKKTAVTQEVEDSFKGHNKDFWKMYLEDVLKDDFVEYRANTTVGKKYLITDQGGKGVTIWKLDEYGDKSEMIGEKNSHSEEAAKEAVIAARSAKLTSGEIENSEQKAQDIISMFAQMGLDAENDDYIREVGTQLMNDNSEVAINLLNLSRSQVEQIQEFYKTHRSNSIMATRLQTAIENYDAAIAENIKQNNEDWDVAETYNNARNAAQTAADIDNETFDAYANSLSEYGNLADEVAVRTINLNTGLKSLSDGYLENANDLDKASTATYKYYAALSKMIALLEQAGFGTSTEKSLLDAVKIGGFSSLTNLFEELVGGNEKAITAVRRANLANNTQDLNYLTAEETEKLTGFLDTDLEQGQLSQDTLTYVNELIKNNSAKSNDIKKLFEQAGFIVGEENINEDKTYKSLSGFTYDLSTNLIDAKVLEKALKKDYDHYYSINQQIAKTEKALDKLSKAKDKAYGADKLRLMEQEEYLLQQEIKDQEDLIALAHEQASNRKQELLSAIDGRATVRFDENGRILNYEQLAETLGKEAWEEIEDYIDKYVEELDKIDEAEEKRQDRLDELAEKVYDRLSYEVEIKTSLNENDAKLIEYFLSKVEDDIYKVAEATQYLSQQENNIKDSLAIQKDAYAKLQAERGNLSEQEYNDLLQERFDGTMDALQALNDYDAKMKEYYGNTLSKAMEEMDKYTNQLESAAQLLEHYQDLLEVSGQGKDYERLNRILQGMLTQTDIQLEQERKTLAFLKDQRAQILEAYNQATDEEVKRKLREDLMALDEQIKDHSDKVVEFIKSKIETLKQFATNNIEDAFDKIEKNATDGMGFNYLKQELTNIKNISNIWLDNTNKIYETNKLMRQISQQMEKTDNKAAKQKYNAYLNEIKQLQNKEKISKSELELAQGKFKILQAQIALEEAQNAKSIVRLRRDNEGNFGYVYTASEDKVANAEQALDDAANAYYNKQKDILEKSEETIVNAAQTLNDKLKDLNLKWLNGEITDIEQFKALEAQAIQEYNDAVEGAYYNTYLVKIGGPDGILDKLTDREKSLQEDIEKVDSSIRESVETEYPVVRDETQRTTDEIKELANQFVGDPESLSSAIDTNINEMQLLSNELDTVRGKMNSAMVAAQALTSAWLGQYDTIKTLREEYEKLLTDINNAKKAAGSLQTLNQVQDIKEIDDIYDGSHDKEVYFLINDKWVASRDIMNYDDIDFDNLNNNMGKKLFTNFDATLHDNLDALLEEEKINSQYADKIQADTQAYEKSFSPQVSNSPNPLWIAPLINSYVQPADENNFESSYVPVYKKKYGGTKDLVGKYDVFGLGPVIDAEGSSWIKFQRGWVYMGDIEYNSSINKKNRFTYTDEPLSWYQFDTGGYTGQWGPSGKLAMLHQKEIVLNADDTKNFLQAVDILRSIVSVIDLGAMQAMSGSMVSSSINSANNSLNQNVTIHAEFPNAVNHTEIEQAFDNLVNKASQYANRQ